MRRFQAANGRLPPIPTGKVLKTISAVAILGFDEFSKSNLMAWRTIFKRALLFFEKKKQKNFALSVFQGDVARMRNGCYRLARMVGQHQE